MKYNWFVLLSSFLLCGCTENPFGGKSEVTGGRIEISGGVSLSDESAPEGIVVWLEGINISSRTDAAGHFRLALPRGPAGQPPGPVSEHRVCFYLANYSLETISVAIWGDEFFYDRGDIDATGKVRKPVVLRRTLRIETLARPHPENPDRIEVAVDLQADQVSCIEALNPLIGVRDRLSPVDTLGAILLQNLGNDAVTIIRSDPAVAGNERLFVCQSPLTRVLQFDASQYNLPPGTYRAIPYILVEPPDVPRALLNHIGTHVNALRAGYLDKPMRRRGGEFELK